VARIKFKNPPISELVIGVYFERDLPAFRVEHIGLFWSRIRHEFPTVSQRPIIAPPPFVAGSPQFMTIELSDEQFPMPRFWFEAADGITLIQVQKNAFLFNWRKLDDDYPHFETVKVAFDKYLSVFLEFLARDAKITTPNVRVAELTYINTVVPSEYWGGLRDTSLVLPMFQLPVVHNHDDPPAEFHQTSMQRFEDMFLSTTVRSARSPKDATKPALIFELRALGVLNEAATGDVDDWFERAHDTIGACFLSMTSPDIQKRFWEPG